MLRSVQRTAQYLNHFKPLRLTARNMSSSLYTDETPASIKEAKVKYRSSNSKLINIILISCFITGSSPDHPKYPQWPESADSPGRAQGCLQHAMDDVVDQYHDQRAEEGLVSTLEP